METFPWAEAGQIPGAFVERFDLRQGEAGRNALIVMLMNSALRLSNVLALPALLMGTLVNRTTQAIQREFAHWTAADGACGRCVNIYRLSGARGASMAREPGSRTEG